MKSIKPFTKQNTETNSSRWIQPVLTCFFLILSNVAHAHTSSLPDLGAPDLIEYDTATEQRLGRAFTSALHTQYKLFRDLDTNDYIRELGHKLASHTGNDRNYSFYIINDPSINAFAGPDGVIGIHTGLILASESEDELAAVIAHEISHVTQNHLSRRYEYSSTQGGINTVATLIAAILIGSQDASAGMATLMGGMGYNLQQQLKNSRQHESEADAIGITLLHKTGYNPHAMGDFFARLSKQSQTDTTKVPEILRTHPVSDHRLAEAENRALNLKPLNKTTPQSQLKLIQQRIHFLNNSHPQFTIGNVKTFTPQEKCYQEALEHLSKKTHAPECLYTLAFEAKSHPIFLSTLIQTLNKQPVNHTEQLANLKKQVELKIELHPNTTSLPIYYSRLLNKLNLPQTAEKVLEQAEQQLDYKYELYMELSENFAKKQQNARAYFNLAKAYLTTGNPERSQYFLKQAISTKTNNDQNIEQEILLFKSKNDNLLNNKDK